MAHKDNIINEEATATKDINNINKEEDDGDEDEDEDGGWLKLSLGPKPQISRVVTRHMLPTTTSASLTTPPQQQQHSFQVNSKPPTHSAIDFTHHHLHYYPRPIDSFRPSSAGIWFFLQASQNQTKEPYLPQLPKSYLRIKDVKTTVGLLLKYLVYKLKLGGEFEVSPCEDGKRTPATTGIVTTRNLIEITCKGQQLMPFLSLQHVRDNIWNRHRNDVVFLNSSSTSSADHLIMVLNYGRIA